MSTFQYNLPVSNSDLTPIVTLDNAPNDPCDIIVQNINGDGIAVYVGNRNMFNDETYGLKLLDGMAVSLSLGSTDELYAFADNSTQIIVLKTSGNRK
jgi:hypothetical protein